MRITFKIATSVKLLVLVAYLSIVFTSCGKEWLDAKPDIKIALPETLADFQALLDNADGDLTSAMNITSPAFGEIASDSFYLPDAIYNTRQVIEKNAYTWSNTSPYNLVLDWSVNYSNILTCNIILEGLENIKPHASNQAEWDHILGQTLFHRARKFYELAQVFAPPYNQATAMTDLGIPLRMESDVNVKTTRSSVNETYRQIEEDLLRAKNLLPVTPKHKTRASKPAAYAMLSRMYLSMELYEKAGLYADSCLRLNNALLDYNDLVSTAAAPIKALNVEVIFHSQLLNYTSSGSQRRVEPSTRDLYNDNDLRKTVFFGASGGLITFKGNYTGAAISRFNGLSTDEMYLIRSECNARAGKITEALTDLNTLLFKRWRRTSIYQPITATDPQDALIKILLERQKQLLCRGLRWSDLRRLNKDSRFARVITRTIAGNTYTLEPNSYKYTFPIPNDVIQLSKIPQNIGWNN